jgi:hypothetical protein
MTVVLYAVIRSDEVLADTGPGLSGKPLRTIHSNGLGAVVSDDDGPPETNVNTLWAYEAVMERLLGIASALLPARFGTTVDEDSEIEAMLAERAGELTAALQEVGGAVEIAVHPAVAEGAQAPDTGTDYMRARLAERRQAEQLETAAKGLFRASVPRSQSSTAYLVDLANVREFVERITAQGATVTGPWPPYSFVGGGRA